MKRRLTPRFGVRSLLLITLVCSILLALWTRVVRPYSDQAASTAWAKKLGATVTIGPADGPSWKRALVRAMAGPEAFVEATELGLTGVDLPADTAARLSGFRYLRELQLDRTDFDAVDAKGLAGLGRLRYLSLRYTAFDDDVAAIVARQPSLRELRVSATPLTDAGLAKLAESESLVEVYARWTRITADGAAAFRAARQECQLHTHELKE